MITKARAINIYVRDQERAVDFYVNKLGMTKLRDEPNGPDSRWIEVAPLGAESVLVLYTPPGFESRIGGFANVVFDCDDLDTTYQELRSRGVEFTQPPEAQPWGMKMAQLKDVDDNEFVLVESQL